MILEPERGMRTSHCSKTYQLGPFLVRKFRVFPRLFEVNHQILRVFHPALAAKASLAARSGRPFLETRHHSLRPLGQRAITSCG
jgi:hypothetical protein